MLKNFLLCLLLLTACSPLRYDAVPVKSALPSTSFFDGQKTFPDKFLSEKLDLVFVLDTHPDMESFYQTNLFGSDFLSRFQNYDGRYAYTDMSVEEGMIQKITLTKKSEPAEEEEEEKSCSFLYSLFSIPWGIVTSPFGHGAFYSGVTGLRDCASLLNFSSGEKEKEQKAFANGAFLPFENNGAKLESPLTPAVLSYSSIFDQSLRLGTADGGFEAPVLKKSDSYPFVAMLLSLGNGFHSSANSQNQQKSAFFREDSLLVYVLVTTQDMKFDVPPKRLKRQLGPDLAKRMRIIPITLDPDSESSSHSSPVCGRGLFQNPEDQSPKLRSLAQYFKQKPLNICSAHLADKLFREISKSLHSPASLSSRQPDQP